MEIQVKKWADVLQIISGKNQKNVINESGIYPIYGSGGIIGYADDYLCEAGTTVVGRKGTINNPIFVNERFWNVDTAFGIAPGPKLLPKYLFYFCLSFNFKTLDKSTTIPSLAKRDLINIEIPIPIISEQERIVARIEELFSQLDASVNELKTAKERLKVYRQAVYASIYKGLSDMRPITKFFDITGGLTKNSKRNDMPVKMPYLRVANVYYNRLDLSEIKEIGVLEGEVDRCLLEENDLLFVEGNGSKSQIGRVAIWDGSISNCLHQNHIIKGRPCGSMLSEYALYYLISKDGRKQIINVAKSTSGLYTLSTNKIKNLMIPYCDLAQQKQLLNTVDERLSMCDSLEKTVDTALQQAEALRQSILKKTFEGDI